MPSWLEHVTGNDDLRNLRPLLSLQRLPSTHTSPFLDVDSDSWIHANIEKVLQRIIAVITPYLVGEEEANLGPIGPQSMEHSACWVFHTWKKFGSRRKSAAAFIHQGCWRLWAFELSSESSSFLAPQYLHWLGCSHGGRQVHMMTQRYPEDYDGTVGSQVVTGWGMMRWTVCWLHLTLVSRSKRSRAEHEFRVKLVQNFLRSGSVFRWWEGGSVVQR